MASKSKQRRKTNGHANAAPVTVRPSTNIPFNMLELSPDNVRKIYDKAGIAILADSIARVGLIQGLAVQPIVEDGTETGRYSVIGGGRRFRALEQLVSEGRLPNDHPIPCLASDGIAADISLVENAEREALHPLDEFRAFQAMIDAGKPIDETAAAYRVTQNFVKQRLRMAAASPKVLKAYETEEISLELLMAFCATEDHRKQDTVLKGFKNGSIQPYASYIKRAVTEDQVSANDARARFIGLDAYRKAGGAVVADLFGDNNHVFLTDTDLVNRMVDEKLAAIRDQQLAKGWKWAVAAAHIPYDEKSRLDELMPNDMTPEEEQHVAALEQELETLHEIDQPTKKQLKRIEAVEEELAAIQDRSPTYPAEDMARAGVFITLSHSGEVCIDYGYIRPEDQHDDGAENTTAPADPNGAHHSDGAAPTVDTDDATNGMKPLAEKLLQDLTAFRTIGLRNALANDFDVAFLAVLHALVANRFYTSSMLSCLQITTSNTFASNTPGLDTWPATKSHDARHAAWKSRLPKDAKDLWSALSAMGANDRQALFAHCAAATLNAVSGRGQFGSSRDAQVRSADQLAAAMSFSMVDAGWTTTAENYLGRVSKRHILAAVAEAKGEDTANLIDHMKKLGMATEAERLLQGTGWLPEALRTPATANDGEGEAPATEVPVFLQHEPPAEEAAA